MTAVPSPAADPAVRVILWFDTEDYLLPASDDAAARLAALLTARGIRATFKVVGEKARVLERRRRTDVITALARHDIGYHTDLHSVHPTPAEYLAEAGWHDGVAEFVRRERAGADDVRRIFGVPHVSTYGQPGSSWAPQAVAALPQVGIATAEGVSTYVDEGSHVGFDDRPFWYAGVLHVFNMGANGTRMPLHEPGGYEAGREAFAAIHDRVRREGGGLVSIYYHPAEWVHEEFWDAVNFRRGANPPREAWQPPPQLPAAATEAAFARFERYVDAMRSLPGVIFVTASDLPRLYGNQVMEEGVDAATVRDIARRIADAPALDALRDREGRWISPAEQFDVLVSYVAAGIADGRLPATVPVRPLLGPPQVPPAAEALDLPWPAMRDLVVDTAAALRAHRQMPARLFAGPRALAPADVLRATAHVVLTADRGGPAPAWPAQVHVPAGTRVLTERHVADDTPDLFGGWIIHPEGFRAPRIVELARLQAWTLKPADGR